MSWLKKTKSENFLYEGDQSTRLIEEHNVTTVSICGKLWKRL